MIYSDKYATVDTTYLPARRDDDCCLNCSEGWLAHKGWECKWKHDVGWGFNDLTDTERYLTQSMKNSLNTYVPIAITQPTSRTLSAKNFSGQDVTVGMEFLRGIKGLKGKVLIVTPISVTFKLYDDIDDEWNTYAWNMRTFVDEFRRGAYYLPATTEKPKSVDLSDWRTWAKPKSDTECPCGIHKAQCSYHKR